MRKTLISLAILLVPSFASASTADELGQRELEVTQQLQQVLEHQGIGIVEAANAYGMFYDLGELHRDLTIKSRSNIGIEEPTALGTLAMYRATVDVRLAELGVDLATRESIRDLFLTFVDIQQQLGGLRADQTRANPAATQFPTLRRQQ